MQRNTLMRRFLPRPKGRGIRAGDLVNLFDQKMTEPFGKRLSFLNVLSAIRLPS